MTRSARDKANRQNARRSTGPRSTAGKAIVARNAFRHGLAIPVELDPALSQEVERLAIEIAGAQADVTRLQGARRIAEAQVDLARIRRIKIAVMSDPADRLNTQGTRRIDRMVGRTTMRLRLSNAELSRRLGGRGHKLFEQFAVEQDVGAAWSLFQELTHGDSPDDAPPPSLEVGFENVAPKLLILDRYERRALSRRKRAMREFDALMRNEGLSADRPIEGADSRA